MNSSDAVADKEQVEQSLLPFVEWVIQEIEPTRFAAGYRLTPQGLFVAQTALPEIITLYQSWFRERSSGREKSADKCRRRLFGSREPDLLCLYERDLVLPGYLLHCPIPDPQRYRRPYYLGTPAKRGQSLDARDPALIAIKQLKLKERSGQREIELQLPYGLIKVSDKDLGLFQRLSRSCHQLQRRFPLATEDAAEAAKALLAVLRQAVTVRPSAELLLPQRYAGRERPYECRQIWGFYFFIEPDGHLRAFYHVQGRSFLQFLKSEINHLSRNPQIRSRLPAEFSPRHFPQIAALKTHGRRLTVTAEALRDFIEESHRSPLLDRRQCPERTLANLAAAFTESLFKAEPIERRLIMDYVGNKYRRDFNFLVQQVWLFIISPQESLNAVIARVAHNRQLNQYKQRPMARSSRSEQPRRPPGRSAKRRPPGSRN